MYTLLHNRARSKVRERGGVVEKWERTDLWRVIGDRWSQMFADKSSSFSTKGKINKRFWLGPNAPRRGTMCQSFPIDTPPTIYLDIGKDIRRLCIRLSRVEEFRNLGSKKRFYDAPSLRIYRGLLLAMSPRDCWSGQLAFHQSEICCSWREREWRLIYTFFLRAIYFIKFQESLILF